MQHKPISHILMIASVVLPHHSMWQDRTWSDFCTAINPWLLFSRCFFVIHWGPGSFQSWHQTTLCCNGFWLKEKRRGEFGEDLLLKPFLVALILTTMSSLVLCCRPSIGRWGAPVGPLEAASTIGCKKDIKCKCSMKNQRLKCLGSFASFVSIRNLSAFLVL